MRNLWALWLGIAKWGGKKYIHAQINKEIISPTNPKVLRCFRLVLSSVCPTWSSVALVRASPFQRSSLALGGLVSAGRPEFSTWSVLRLSSGAVWWWSSSVVPGEAPMSSHSTRSPLFECADVKPCFSLTRRTPSSLDRWFLPSFSLKQDRVNGIRESDELYC